MKLHLYPELLGDVRNDGKYYPIRSLVQPEDAQVREIAAVLAKSSDFIGVAHQFVHAYTRYQIEEGDFWRTPAESIELADVQLELECRGGKDVLAGLDCDDSAIFLASLLRTRVPAEKVFVAIGEWRRKGDKGGHAWVIVQNPDGTDRILESTASQSQKPYGDYHLEAMFNDKYALATSEGLKDFDLIPAPA